LRSTWLAIAIVLCLAAPARADGITKVFPLSHPALPDAMRTAPAELTRVLAKAHGAEIANVQIEDAAELKECNVGSEKCLNVISRSVGASKIIFGRLDRREGGYTVSLTTFDSLAGEQLADYLIKGDSPESLAASLGEKLAQGSRPKAKVEEPIAPTRVEVPPPVTEPGEPIEPAPVARGGVSKGTWGMIIGGGIAVAAGTVFVISGRSLNEDIRNAPTNTAAEIRQMQALEDRARTRFRIGGVLMVAGGAVATIGVVRAVLQRRAPREEQPMVDVVPEIGGASVLFTVGWR
jgi:hypothetical protein